jgi:rhodanese-related sulfurtransferase
MTGGSVIRVFREALLVALFGAAFGFAANAISARGLKLTRDYFPGASRHTVSTPAPVNNQTQAATHTTATPTSATTPSAEQQAIARLHQKGLQVADDDQVFSLFHDPRYEQGLVIFIDARNEEHFQHGHIPGAYQFYHVYPEKSLPTIMPACNAAQQILIYCNGGDCELSEFAADFLINSLQVPQNKILIYAGGINAWQARKHPIETGDRKSGQISSPTK